MLCSISNQVHHILGSFQVQSQQIPELAESDNERSSGHKPIDYRPGEKVYDKEHTQQRKNDMDNTCKQGQQQHDRDIFSSSWLSDHSITRCNEDHIGCNHTERQMS